MDVRNKLLYAIFFSISCTPLYSSIGILACVVNIQKNKIIILEGYCCCTLCNMCISYKKRMYDIAFLGGVLALSILLGFRVC